MTTTPNETIVNMHEAKTHLSRLVIEAEHGKIITIARAGKVIARIVPIEQPQKAKRMPGLLQGLSVPRDFDAPLPKKELDLWHT